MPTGDGLTTGAERVRDHHDRQRKRGLKLIRVWVPAKSADQVRRLAADLRKKAGAPLLHDYEIPASPKPRRSPPVPPKKAAKAKTRSTSAEKLKTRAAASKPKAKQPATAKAKTRSKSEEKPKKRRSPSKERRYQRRKAERAARAKK